METDWKKPKKCLENAWRLPESAWRSLEEWLENVRKNLEDFRRRFGVFLKSILKEYLKTPQRKFEEEGLRLRRRLRPVREIRPRYVHVLMALSSGNVLDRSVMERVFLIRKHFRRSPLKEVLKCAKGPICWVLPIRINFKENCRNQHPKFFGIKEVLKIFTWFRRSQHIFKIECLGRISLRLRKNFSPNAKQALPALSNFCSRFA